MYVITNRRRLTIAAMALGMLALVAALFNPDAPTETKTATAPEERDHRAMAPTHHGDQQPGPPQALPVPEAPLAPVEFFPRTRMGNRLRGHFDLAQAYGDDAEANFQASLAQLRRNPSEAVETIRAVYDALPEQAYLPRYFALDTAARLQTEFAEPFLSEVATLPIPPETSTEHHFSSVREETMIRVAAVKGLGDLAHRGSDDALNTLTTMLEHPKLTVRREVIDGVLDGASDRPAALAQLRELLPKSQHWLIEQPVTPRETIDVPPELTALAADPPVERPPAMDDG